MLQYSQSKLGLVTLAWLRGFRKSVTFDVLYADWELTIIFFSVYLLNVKLHLQSVNYVSHSQQQIDWFSGSPPVSTLSAQLFFLKEKSDFNLQQLNHFHLPLRMLKIAIPKYKISKFPGGACPRTPLDTSTSGSAFISWRHFLSNLPSLHSTGSLVLEFLSVRRIFVVPKDRICKLIFFWE